MRLSKSQLKSLIEEELTRLREDDDDDLIAKAKELLEKFGIAIKILDQALSILKPPSRQGQPNQGQNWDNRKAAWEVILDQLLEAGFDPQTFWDAGDKPDWLSAIRFIEEIKYLRMRYNNRNPSLYTTLNKFITNQDFANEMYDSLNSYFGRLASEERTERKYISLAKDIITTDKRNQQSLAPWQRNK